MGPSTAGSDVGEEATGAILEQIDEKNGKSVKELASDTDYSSRQVQHILEKLMEQGKITSTPDWRYRESRRSEA